MTQSPPSEKLRELHPPYASFSCDARVIPTLGSIFTLDMSDAETGLEEAILWQGRAPWCPLVLVLGSTLLSAGIIELLSQLHGPMGFVSISQRASPEIGEILNAVRARPTPTPSTVFSYVANRLGNASVRDLLTESLALAAEPRCGPLLKCIRRRVSRQLRALGPLGIPDWNRLSKLALLSGLRHVQVEELARLQGVEPRTLRAQVRRYTGVSPRNFREWVGWEWVIEAALRRWGYLETGPAVSFVREA
jgi:hypothetical protein